VSRARLYAEVTAAGFLGTLLWLLLYDERVQREQLAVEVERGTRSRRRLAAAERERESAVSRLAQVSRELGEARAREDELNQRMRDFVFRAERVRDEMAHVALVIGAPGGRLVPTPGVELGWDAIARLAHLRMYGPSYVENSPEMRARLLPLVRHGLASVRSTIDPHKLHVRITDDGLARLRRDGGAG